MRLYHGSIANFDYIDLRYCLERKDFGRGFYMTENLDIAKAWGLRQRRGNTRIPAYVYMAKIDIEEMRKVLNVHVFKESIPWVDYIIYNRIIGYKNIGLGKLPEEYDVVIGKIADGPAQTAVQEFYNEYGLSASMEAKTKLIRELSKKDLKNQVCFKTERAVRYLEHCQRAGRLSKKEIWR